MVMAVITRGLEGGWMDFIARDGQGRGILLATM